MTELVKELSPETKQLFKTELQKYSKYFNTNLKELSPEQITALLAQLNTDKTNLGNKIIQLETQISEKQKEIDKKLAEMLQKYEVDSLEALIAKKTEVEADLEKVLLELKTILEVNNG